MLVLGGAEDGDARGVAADHADLADRRADQLALVGDQQDLVELLDREGGRKAPALLGEVLRQQALAASAGAPELIGRGTLAEALRGDRQDDFLSRAQSGDALAGQGFFPDVLVIVRRGDVLDLIALAADGRAASTGTRDCRRG